MSSIIARETAHSDNGFAHRDIGPGLKATELSRRFTLGSDLIRAVGRVSIDLFLSELAVLMGRSGSDKTTLLNLLGCLRRPTSGEVLFQGIGVFPLTASQSCGEQRLASSSRPSACSPCCPPLKT